MTVLDFTDKLEATLTGVPRKHVVKFNNCWLHLDTGPETQLRDQKFLVVYRAMVHKVKGPNGWQFAEPAATLPGQAGTPWGGAWRGPVGPAVTEGEVPPERGERYFDGIGVAKVQLKYRNWIWSVKVLSDQIIENSDGYEDPRIFRVAGQIYVHSHRYQPDRMRKAPTPRHLVFDGFPPQRKPYIPGETDTPERSLFVKINALKETGPGQYELGQESFYGTNITQRIEKNFGFFEENGYLNAVYGPTPHGRPFTVFLAIKPTVLNQPGVPGSDNTIPVAEVRPNIDKSYSDNADSFYCLRDVYDNYVPGRGNILISSGSPLIKNAQGKWQGVGHVKIRRERIYSFLCSLFTSLTEIIAELTATPVKKVTGAKVVEFVNEPQYKAKMLSYIQQHPNAGYAQLSRFLFNKMGLSRNEVPDVVRHELVNYQRALIHNFIKTPLAYFVDLEMSKPHTLRWENRITSDRSRGVDNRNTYHPHCSYLSFFYEIDNFEGGHRLLRFSDAFIVDDETNYHSLQFATGLSRSKDYYIMSYGDGDNRAKLFVLSQDRFELMMRHKAEEFLPRNFKFECVSSEHS